MEEFFKKKYAKVSATVMAIFPIMVAPIFYFYKNSSHISEGQWGYLVLYAYCLSFYIPFVYSKTMYFGGYISEPIEKNLKHRRITFIVSIIGMLVSFSKFMGTI